VPTLAGNFLAGLHWKRHRAASCSFKMISFANINKQYGKQLLFVDASFQLNPGEKVGLVGPNGAGKTTLFRMGGRRGNSRRGRGLSSPAVDPIPSVRQSAAQ
jgi:ABC-type polysaccharide/polyol phosphate transport system ATPase subunit